MSTLSTQLKWRRLSADAYEASGTGHQYAVLFLGFDAETPWFATTSDVRYLPRGEHCLAAGMLACMLWADDDDKETTT
jgi:hypothetical protein